MLYYSYTLMFSLFYSIVAILFVKVNNGDRDIGFYNGHYLFYG